MKNKKPDIWPPPKSLEDYQGRVLTPADNPAEAYPRTAREWARLRRRLRSRVSAGFRGIIADLLRARDGDRCFWCGMDGAGEGYQIDHHVPIWSGGETVLENLRLLCLRCNSLKGTKSPDEFAFLVAQDLL